MDLLLNNGDFALSPNGLPITISGIDEIKQQIIIALQCKNNSFIYNKNFGSDIYKINDSTSQNEIYRIVKSALVKIQNLQIINVFFNTDENILNIDLLYNSNTINIQLNLKGE